MAVFDDCRFGDQKRRSADQIATFNACFDIVKTAQDFLVKNIQDCKYYDIETHLPICKTENSLFLIHFNIRSLQKNFDLLYEFLQQLTKTPDIICISETRLKTDLYTNIRLPNYRFICDNSTSNAGGTGIYITNNIKFELLDKLHIDIEGYENLWIKLLDYNIIIITIYRHPKANKKSFLEALEKKLQSLKNITYFIVGDLNINTINKNNNVTNELSNMIASLGTFPIITLPTRVTENSKTLIDHILTNDHLHGILPGVFRSDITDHYPIFCIISNLPSKREDNPKYFRNLKNFNVDQYCDELNGALHLYFSNLPQIDSNNFDAIFHSFI